MPWYAYVETYYDPPPAGWAAGAYTEFRSKLNHAQLASWASGAIAWSQESCRQAVVASGGTWEQSRWRRANPTMTQRRPPAGTPVYSPRSNVLAELNTLADEGDEEVSVAEEDESAE